MLEFKKFIENYTSISNLDFEIISKCFEFRKVTKNEITCVLI